MKYKKIIFLFISIFIIMFSNISYAAKFEKTLRGFLYTNTDHIYDKEGSVKLFHNNTYTSFLSRIQ